MATTSVNVITYATPGTYNYVSSIGMRNIIVEVLAGGASTVSFRNNTGGTAGLGGGAGGYCKSVYSANFIKEFSEIIVTVGAGGAAPTTTDTSTVGGKDGEPSSFGPVLIATGGQGSLSAFTYQAAGTKLLTVNNFAGSTSLPPNNGLGGAGGIGAGGNIINMTGQAGGAVLSLQGTIGSFITSGIGGSTIYGSGGTPKATGSAAPISTVGNPGVGFGSGGGGSATVNTTIISGSAGANGLVIVTEYIVL